MTYYSQKQINQLLWAVHSKKAKIRSAKLLFLIQLLIFMSAPLGVDPLLCSHSHTSDMRMISSRMRCCSASTVHSVAPFHTFRVFENFIRGVNNTNYGKQSRCLVYRIARTHTHPKFVRPNLHLFEHFWMQILNQLTKLSRSNYA